MRGCARLISILAICLFVAVGLLAAPDTASCRKTCAFFDVYALETGTGGGLVNGMTMDRRSKVYAAGVTWDYGSPSVACVWPVQNDCSGGCTYELLPSLDVTKDSEAMGVGVVIEITGGGSDTSLVVTGYSYDSLNRIRPMRWERDISGSVWTYQELPTLVGGEGSATGSLKWPQPDPDEDLAPLGWSEGVATNKAVIWTENGAGGWAIRALPHDGPGYAGCALDGQVSAFADTFVCGWTVSAVGDTIPVVWQNSGGGWVKTSLPILPGGDRGMALSWIQDYPGEERVEAVGWSENSSGQRCAVRWHYDSGWQVEELDQLAGFSHSVAHGAAVCPAGDFEQIVVGKSYDPGAPVGTIWGILGQPGNEFTRDINDLILTDLAPTIREAVGVGLNSADMLIIAANGVEAQLGGYAVSQSSTPQAYVLVETEIVPAMGSYRGTALLVLFLAVLSSILLLRRRAMVRAG